VGQQPTSKIQSIDVCNVARGSAKRGTRAVCAWVAGGEGDGFGQTFAVKSLRGVLRGKRPLTPVPAGTLVII